VLVGGGYMVKNALIEQSKPAVAQQERKVENVIPKEEKQPKLVAESIPKKRDVYEIVWLALKNRDKIEKYIVEMLPMLGELAKSGDKEKLHEIKGISDMFIGTPWVYDIAMSYIAYEENPTKDEIIGAFAFVLLSTHVRAEFNRTYNDIMDVEIIGAESKAKQDNRKEAKQDNRKAKKSNGEYLLGNLRDSLDAFAEGHPRYAILKDYAYLILGSPLKMSAKELKKLERKFKNGQFGDAMHSMAEYKVNEVSKFIDVASKL